MRMPRTDTARVGFESSSRRSAIARPLLHALVAAAGALTGPRDGGRGLAVSSEELAAQYDRYASSYEALDGGVAADALGLSSLRAKAIARSVGNVLEVGVGTGLNLPLYESTRVQKLTAIDLSPGMLREAAAAVERLPSAPPVAFASMDAASLSYADGVFDTVVDTFSLCVMLEPELALAEMRRVCAAGGRVILLEHTRSSAAPLGLYQDVSAPAAAAFLGKGCVYNQDVAAMLPRAGLRVLRKQEALLGLVTLFEATPA